MNIVEEYKSALGNYLHNGGEESLRRAYELGRKAIAEDLGSIDMIITHQQALQELLRAARTADDSAQLTEAASTFLAEMFSPFEMTFLGFRDALNTIQQSEERYRTMIESAQDVIYTLSTDGIIKSLNPVFEKVTGWKPSDWIGKSFTSLVHPEDLPFALSMFERVVGGETPPVFEIRLRSKSGEYLVGEFTTSPESYNGKAIGVFGIARDITERKRVQDQLRALAKRVVEAQEEERRRLARELHDDLCQWLSGLKLSLGLLEEPSKYKSIQNKLRQLKQQVNTRIIEVRRMSINLRPSALDDFGLNIALERLCEDYEKIHEIKITFNANDLTAERYPSEVEIAIYRIVQEALWNIIKHAKASKAGVRLFQINKTIVLEVRDNGIGIDHKKAKSQKSQDGGLGLISMKERSEVLGGKFQVESSPGKGTKIRTELPVESSRS